LFTFSPRNEKSVNLVLRQAVVVAVVLPAERPVCTLADATDRDWHTLALIKQKLVLLSGQLGYVVALFPDRQNQPATLEQAGPMGDGHVLGSSEHGSQSNLPSSSVAHPPWLLSHVGSGAVLCLTTDACPSK
jgi:hypothetical protein